MWTEAVVSREFIRPIEAAERLNVSIWTIYRWIKAGKLDAVKLGRSTVRVSVGAVDRFIAEHRALHG
jgi:excisionase family DNA binding protein